MAARRWTTQQVLALAPDAKAVAAARKLTAPRTWSQLGCTSALVWGRCQGSAKEPYQVTVDLAEPAFRCTCPSRKLPCKHGLALLLLWVEHGAAVAEVEAAAGFADDWAQQRSQRATRRQERRRSAEVLDPDAQAQREVRREEAMSAGLAELERWLGDLVRQGLAGARRQPYAFWDAMAARLVDAQLPGLADRVRDAGGAVQARPDWAEHLVAECGRWLLAARAWQRRDVLGPDLLADLRGVLGWARRPDEVARFPTVADRWHVAGVRQGEDGRIVSQRTWLWGEATQRWLLVLDFATSAAALGVASVVGSVVEDALVVHPGSTPARAAFSGAQRVVGTGGGPRAASIGEAVDAITAALAGNPWREHLPAALRDVVPVEDAGGWWLQDPGGDRLPLAGGEDPWPLLALSGGHPATVVVEWHRGRVHPMSVLAPEPVML